MKKMILTGGLAVAMLFTSTVNAQTSNDKTYGPEAGDYGIGISANPILRYFGNFFGKTTTNNAPAWNSLTESNTIIGRYFLEDNLAIRAKFHLGFVNDKNSNQVLNRGIDQSSVSFPDLTEKVENTWKHSEYNFGIAGGLEWRTRFNRLHLFYGAELGIGMSGKSDKYTYGNALAPTADIPVTIDPADAMNGGANLGKGTYSTSRVLSNKYDKQFMVGLRGFFGVEYFVASKISLAGEFGWGFAFIAGSADQMDYEAIGVKAGATDPSVASITEKGSKSTNIGADPTTNKNLFGPAGTISINFYF